MSLEKNVKGIAYSKASAKEAKALRKMFGDEIQVSRYMVKVVYVKELTIDGDEACGGYDPKTKTIYIDIGYPESVETFLHELFHAEIVENGITQYPGWCRSIEEVVVDVLSRSVAHAFKLKKR